MTHSRDRFYREHEAAGEFPASDILTSHDRPHVPTTQFDWSAIRKGYEPGDKIGRGETEAAAIANLLDQELDA